MYGIIPSILIITSLNWMDCISDNLKGPGYLYLPQGSQYLSKEGNKIIISANGSDVNFMTKEEFTPFLHFHPCDFSNPETNPHGLVLPQDEREKDIFKQIILAIPWEDIKENRMAYISSATTNPNLRGKYPTNLLKQYKIIAEHKETVDGIPFTRFGLLSDGSFDNKTRYFAVVGIQRGIYFGRIAIRTAFLFSLNEGNPRPIWLTHNTVSAEPWGLKTVQAVGSARYWTA